MSMYVLTKVRVKNANRELLHEALKLLAKHEGFAVSDFDTNPELFVLTKDGGELVEVEVGKDEIKVKGDSDFISRQELNGLAQMVKQYYVAVATVATLRRSGYSSARMTRAGENLYVEAV